jgi:hypothetical protein
VADGSGSAVAQLTNDPGFNNLNPACAKTWRVKKAKMVHEIFSRINGHFTCMIIQFMNSCGRKLANTYLTKKL